MGTEAAAPDRPVRVLLVDDDQEDFLITRDLLADLPEGRFELGWVATFEAGLRALAAGEYDVYLVDYRLGPRTGLDLLRTARRDGLTGAVILFTGQGERQVDLDAMQAGAATYLEKAGLTSDVLERTIRYALLQKGYEAELEAKVRERTGALEAANARLREDDRRKDEFLGTLAHELRNPLAPLLNALEIMRLKADDAEAVARARGLMERQVGVMVRLIDDLLDVSRITRGKLELKPEVLDFREVVDAALEVSGPLIEKAELTLTTSLPDEPVRLKGDRTRLAQVLTNLLNNAAKYSTPGGSVALTVARDDAGSVVVRVRDTGIGIAREALARVFDLFTQIERDPERSQGGLGIGLALVRRLVEMHRGTVTAHSDGPGRGAEFVVRLPGTS